MNTFSITKKLTSAFVVLILTTGTGVSLTACGGQNQGQKTGQSEESSTGASIERPIVYGHGENPSVSTYPVTDGTSSNRTLFRFVLSRATYSNEFSASDIAITTDYGDFQIVSVNILDSTNSMPGEIIEPNTDATVTVKAPEGLPDEYSYTVKLNSNILDTKGNLTDPLTYYGSDLRKTFFKSLDSADSISILSNAYKTLYSNTKSANASEGLTFPVDFWNNLYTLSMYISLESEKVPNPTLQKYIDEFTQFFKDKGYVISEGIRRLPEVKVVADGVFRDFTLPTKLERVDIQNAAPSKCTNAKTGSYNLFCGDLANLKTASSTNSSFTDMVKALGIIANDFESALNATAKLIDD
jgi:hypothetical protein